MRFLAPLFVVAVLATTLETVPVSGQPVVESVIVVFHDDSPFGSFPAARADARLRRNPQAWQYLNPFVLGAVHSLERQYGFQADHVYSAAVRGFAARLTPDQIEALQQEPLVNYIERDNEMRPFAQALPWGIDRIDADVSSARSGDGAGEVTGVNIYVLDNGLDRAHPDLNVVNHVNFTTAVNAATCAHGTRVAGVIAARDNDLGVVGVVPGALLTAVKVTTCDPVSSASTAIKGVDWVTQNAIRPAVANMSIGGFANSTLDAAVKRSADSGVFYAIAAGNNSWDACWTSPQRAGTHGGVMTVAATAENDSEASFSNYGRCVDIWAPGANVTTTDLGGATVTSSGTSYAAPHVAGTAALYLAANPTASAAAVETALKTGALAPGTVSRDGRAVKLVYAGRY